MNTKIFNIDTLSARQLDVFFDQIESGFEPEIAFIHARKSRDLIVGDRANAGKPGEAVWTGAGWWTGD